MSVTEKHIEQILSGAKTVYFLGAGASNASRFELPTMDRFFSKEDLPLDDFPELHRFMKSHFRHTCAEAPGLEDVITYLELALDRFGSFGKYPRLGAIWSIVQRELASSTCIVFIGVGFRLSDYYLSWLIKSSCVGKEHAERLVVLVDKDEELPDRVEELVGKRPVYCGSLKSYISALSKMGHAREYG